MQSIIDMMQERGDNNVQIAFNMFTIAHLKAMAFVLAGKMDMSPTTTMVIYEHQLLTELKKELKTVPEEYRQVFINSFDKDLQRQLDKNLVSNME